MMCACSSSCSETMWVQVLQNGADVAVDVTVTWGDIQRPASCLVGIVSTIDLWEVRVELVDSFDPRPLVEAMVLPAGVFLPLGKLLPDVSGPYRFRLTGSSAGTSPARVGLALTNALPSS